MVTLPGQPEPKSPNCEAPERVTQPCERCGRDLTTDEPHARYKVCSRCGRHFPLSARERIALLADPGSFRETLANLYPTDPLRFVDRIPYRERLEEARRKTGLADAAVTGLCRIDGQDAVLAVLDFRFLGGSMGSVVGEKIAAACELATLCAEPVSKLVQRRYDRWRHIGRTTIATAAAAGRLAEQIETGFRRGTQRLSDLAQHIPGPLHAKRGPADEPESPGDIPRG